MSGLAELQQAFAAELLGRQAAMAVHVHDGPRTGRDTLIGVYRYAYAARLVEALAHDFPATAALMGDEGFSQAARAYVADHPSSHPSIRWLGRDLAAHLSAHGHDAAGALAAFEWALGLAFDGADAPVLDPAALAALPPERWENLTMRFHPSVQHLILPFAAHDAWAAWQGGVQIALSPLDAPVHLLVWRQDLDLLYRPLQAGEDRLLAHCLGGARFADGLLDLDPNQAVGWLAGWCAAGMVAALTG